MKEIIGTIIACIGLAQPAIWAAPSDGWFAAKGETNGNLLIVRAKESLPDVNTRKVFPWLTVITWEYPLRSGGLPEPSVNDQIEVFESTTESKLEKAGLCVLAIIQTGNGKKEWSYYIQDREKFMEAFNKSFDGKPALPIKIEFYNDPDWKELEQLLAATNK